MTVWGWAAANSSQQEGEEDEGRRWRRRAVLALDWAETVFRVAWYVHSYVPTSVMHLLWEPGGGRRAGRLSAFSCTCVAAAVVADSEAPMCA